MIYETIVVVAALIWAVRRVEAAIDRHLQAIYALEEVWRRRFIHPLIDDAPPNTLL